MRFFGHLKPERRNGELIGAKYSPVKVKTRTDLGPQYGPDRDKRLVFTAHKDDLLGIRPERTQRELFIRAADLYAYLIRLAAGREHLEKARARKAAKAERLRRSRDKRAERRLISHAA